MPARPRIGLTTYPPNPKGRFDLPAEYVSAVRRAGGEPVLLPPSLPGEAIDAAALVDWVDGLVLTGGGDIDAAAWGEPLHPGVYGVHPERDRDEIALVGAATAAALPTLAICRGAQIVNVARGGSLHQHLPEVVDGTVVHRDEARLALGEPGGIPHSVRVEVDCLVGRLLAARTSTADTDTVSTGTLHTSTVSWHHQAMRQLGDGVRAVAWAPDGTIEAIEVDDHPWLVAVQWHPELSAATDPTQQGLFDALVAEAAVTVGP